MNSQELVLSTIEELIYSGGNGNFAILQLGSNYYMQVALGKGDVEAYCEAVSNHFLKTESHLGESQLQMLERLGWSAHEEGFGNFYLAHSVSTKSGRKVLSKLLVETARFVYDYDAIQEGNINLNLE